jgi:type II secretory pathway pseudopilin PulG
MTGQSTRSAKRVKVIVAAVLVATLGAAVAVRANRSITRAKEEVLRADLRAMAEAITWYRADKKRYPPSLTALVDARYLRALPEDPFTGSNATWQGVSSGDEPGVTAVRSGSNRAALDGTRYSDW